MEKEQELIKRIEALEDDANTVKQKLVFMFRHVLKGLNSLSLALILVCGVLIYMILTDSKGDDSE